MQQDAVIIGGAFVGLAAATYLASARRRVCVIDAGQPGNRFAEASHGFLGIGGSDPLFILASARDQLAAYPTVALTQSEATEARSVCLTRRWGRLVRSRPVSFGGLARQGTGANHGGTCRSSTHSASLGHAGSRHLSGLSLVSHEADRCGRGASRRKDRDCVGERSGDQSPYLLFKAGELYFALSYVPQPLQVSWIEYRLERSGGLGMPGANETGFVVYRMTGGSIEWARSRGQNLGAMLPDGSTVWHPTPVDDSSDLDRWHANDSASTPPDHAPNLEEYLDRYGFSIPIENGRDIGFNDAIRNPGSFYSYGRGGSVRVVDPKRGKIYVAYAG